MAPRREPVERTVLHMLSQMCIKESGPLATCPVCCATMPLWPQSRKIQADATALLQGQRALLEGIENARHGIFDAAHHKAVKQGNAMTVSPPRPEFSRPGET